MKAAAIGITTGLLFVGFLQWALCYQCQAAEKKSVQPQSKTARCMDIEDFKLAMACLQGLVVEHNREKMRQAIKAY